MNDIGGRGWKKWRHDKCDTVQKMKFSIKDFSSKRDQIRRKLRIWSHLLEKSLMEKFIFCALWHGERRIRKCNFASDVLFRWPLKPTKNNVYSIYDLQVVKLPNKLRQEYNDVNITSDITLQTLSINYVYVLSNLKL